MSPDRIPHAGERTALLKGGSIFHDGKVTPCVVRALSEQGARLQVYAPDKLPATFRLFVELNRMEVGCELVWRKGKEVGVHFTGQPVLSGADGPAGRLIEGEAVILPAARLRRATDGDAIDLHMPERRIPMLIAEDDPDDRLLISEAFRDSGTPYDLKFVENGEEALRYLAGAGTSRGWHVPALILLDLNMPKIDGRAVLRHIKQDPRLKRIPIIVFTTSNSDEDIESTYELGVSSYIVKPSHYQGLLDVVQLLNQYWGNQVVLPR